jgi:hypothetical protein
VKRILLLLAVLGLAAACSDPYRRIYENMRSVRDSKRTPAERAISPSPSYDEYKKEREGKPKE